MIRETIIAKEDSYTLHFPKEWKDKTVTIVYDTEENVLPVQPKKMSMDELSEYLKPYRMDLSNWKFDRNEANDYE